MVNIALIGYGSMGKELERLAATHGCSVVSIYDENTPLSASSAGDAWDVAIDFSIPSAVLDNASVVSSLKRNLVIGTTGWYDNTSQLIDIQEQNGNGIIWGSNYSIGVQMFFQLARLAGELVNTLPDYDVMIHEWHHMRKKDSPSGTALTAAQIIMSEVDRKEDVASETQHHAINPTDLHVSSTRGGEIVGKHVITLDSLVDTIEITHNAKSRSGFASGALRAAAWIHQRQGLYDFTDVFTEVIKP